MDSKVFEALDRAWERMVAILFSPFDFGKWLVLGFTAWLAYLWEGYGGGGYGGGGNFEKLGEALKRMGNGASTGSGQCGGGGSTLIDGFGGLLSQCPGGACGLPSPSGGMMFGIGLMIVVGLVFFLFVLALILLFSWLKSRGDFMFIDNLVNNRALVGMPWREYAGEGNSAFGWRVCFWLASLVVWALVAALFFFVCAEWFMDMVRTKGFIFPGTDVWIGLAALILLAIVTALMLGLIDFSFNHLVVPLMYRNRVGALAAWSGFTGLLKAAPGAMIRFILIMLAVKVIIGFGILILCVVTCCIFAFVICVPYIWAVVLLPVLVFVRCFDLEFLAGFGAEFDAWTVVYSDEEDPVPSAAVDAVA